MNKGLEATLDKLYIRKASAFPEDTRLIVA